MSGRVLSGAAVGQTPTTVSRPVHVVDDATRALVEREVAAAHERGVAEGRAAAVAEARAEARAVADAVDRGIAELQSTLAAQLDELAVGLATRVRDTTAAVLGHEPDDEGAALIDRLRTVLARVEDPQLQVRVSAAREAVVREALAARSDATVTIDDALTGDDVQVTGEFVRIDLRRDALLDALEEVLQGHEPLGPVPGVTQRGSA